MWKNEVVPRLKTRFPGEEILSRTIKTFVIAEARVSELVQPFFQSSNPTLGIYSHPDGIHIRIIARGDNARQLLDTTEAQLEEILAPHVWGKDSDTLEGIIYQVLLPRSHGQGRVAAVEVLLATAAVRNLIREGKTHQMPNAIQTGGQYGMQSLNQSLRALCQYGMISPEEALARSTDAEELKQMLGGH